MEKLPENTTFLDTLKRVGHFLLDEIHYEPERARGGSEMLDRLLLDAPNQMVVDEHSELYELWKKEQGTNW